MHSARLLGERLKRIRGYGCAHGRSATLAAKSRLLARGRLKVGSLFTCLRFFHIAFVKERFSVICSEHPLEHLRRMTRARPLLDPFAQGRIPSAPCTLAPLHSVSPYQDWRCKQLCRSCLAGVRPDHLRSCDRQFLPMPFRQLGALSQSGALLRSLTTGLVWQSGTMRKSTATLHHRHYVAAHAPALLAFPTKAKSMQKEPTYSCFQI